MEKMSDNFTEYLQKLPESSRNISLQAWKALPADLRQELNVTIKLFSNIAQSNPNALSDLLELLKRQAGPALQPLSHIAVVGPVNVGKSTLFNALLNSADEHAAVSPLPGTTVVSQTANAGAISLVDTPGLDNANTSGRNEYAIALESAAQADFLLVVFDASRGITTSDYDLYKMLRGLNKPYLIALNKIDLIEPKQRESVVQAAASALGISKDFVQPVSASLRQGVAQLLLEVAVVEPRLLGELGKTLKPIRGKLSWQAIRRAAVISCAIALSPLPIIDFIPLTIVQTTLVLTLARIYNEPMNYARASELITTLGAGLLARNLAAQISKAGGPPGWAISASIATACTVAIGYSCMLWFSSGIKPSAESSKKLIQALGDVLLKLIKSIGRKKEDRPKLDEALSEAVERTTRQLCEQELSQALGATPVQPGQSAQPAGAQTSASAPIKTTQPAPTAPNQTQPTSTTEPAKPGQG